MKDLKDFEEFIKKELLKNKLLINLEQEFLIKESEKNYLFLLQLLNKFEIEDNIQIHS